MSSTASPIIEITPVDAQEMLKRLFKVADLLSGYTTETDEFLVENHASQEIEYGVMEGQQPST